MCGESSKLQFSYSLTAVFLSFSIATNLAPLHVCHFETSKDACEWHDDTKADYSWTFNTGNTPSGDTGPSYDYTTGQEDGNNNI